MAEGKLGFRRVYSSLKIHPQRGRRVAHLAYPVALGMLSITLLNIVDTAMLGRLGSIPLAAAGISGVGYFAIVFSISGIGVGVQTLASRRYGEGKQEESGLVLTGGLILGLMAGIPLVLVGKWLAIGLAPLLSGELEVARLGELYLRYRFYGAGFLLLNQVYGGFYNGVGDTKKQMISAIIVTTANIVLDYMLIFGHAGFPRLGIQGAAIASTIATGLGTAYFVAVSLGPRYLHRYSLYRGVSASISGFRSILRLSFPVIGQRFLSNGSFFIFFGIVARIGTLELAATNVMRSVYGVSIMPALGFAVAAATLVGQNMGADRPEEAEQDAWEAAKLAAYLMGAVGLTFVLFPRAIFSVYTSDPAVTSLGRLPLMLLGVVQMLGGVAIVLSQALQGAGNTRFVMFAELMVCSVLYLPAAYFLGLKFGLGIVGAWSAEYIYWAALAVIMSYKFRLGTWKSIRV